MTAKDYTLLEQIDSTFIKKSKFSPEIGMLRCFIELLKSNNNSSLYKRHHELLLLCMVDILAKTIIS